MAAATASRTWRYDAAQALVAQSGSANNWAFGYNTHGRVVREPMLERVRREAERCDMLDGFLLLHSMAGGTGSGLGASACCVTACRPCLTLARTLLL